MAVELKKTSIDLGIVTNNADALVAFYRDLLGFREEPSTPFPGGGKMYRLWCGDSLIKLVAPADPVQTEAATGPIPAATGYRYWTMHVTNLAEIMAECEAAGAEVIIPVSEIRPGVTIGIVADPDGNCVEFVTYA
ncbi:MAG: VOC family protein [Pseudomonadota bacterium]